MPRALHLQVQGALPSLQGPVVWGRYVGYGSGGYSTAPNPLQNLLPSIHLPRITLRVQEEWMEPQTPRQLDQPVFSASQLPSSSLRLCSSQSPLGRLPPDREILPRQLRSLSLTRHSCTRINRGIV